MLVVTRGGYRPTSDHEPAVEAEPFYGNDGEIDDASSPVACSCLDAPGRRRTCLRTVTRCRRRAGAHQSRGSAALARAGAVPHADGQHRRETDRITGPHAGRAMGP